MKPLSPLEQNRREIFAMEHNRGWAEERRQAPSKRLLSAEVVIDILLSYSEINDYEILCLALTQARNYRQRNPKEK